MIKMADTHIALVFALPLLLAGDAPPAPRDVSPMLRTLVDRYKLPGIVGAMVQGDRVVALGSAGVHKLGEAAPFRSTDIIHLGSDTKAMTAFLIGQLIDQKKLRFDSAMSEVFLGLAAKMDPALAKVTVRQLLNHNAGLTANLDWDALDAAHADLPAQRRQAVEKALSSPPASPIGNFSYSNVGYVILGAIIEAKTGKPWEAVMGQSIRT